MSCESTRRLRLLLTALVVVLAMLWIPALGHAAERDTVASTGLLERGSGYGTAGGSDAVRVVQRRLLRLGHEPGPIDGLYGPLTQGAVERFQQRHGLAVDGIVGRQTRRTLLPRRFEPTASRVERDTRPGTFARKSPAPSIGSESASEHPHARPLTAGAATRDGPVSGTSGVPPEAIAAVAALAVLLLFLTLRSQGEVRLNLGLTCAALLGVFGIGAVAGAVFATRAAPHGTDRATAQSGLLVAGNPAARSSRRSPSTVRWARPRRVKVPAQVAAAPARPATAPAPISPPPSPQTSLASPNAPAAPAAPPERVAKPRIRVQARLDGGARKVIRASPGGGAVAATDSSAP
ncbi:MAG TPA: peptidoglycan-binding domain-containing protein [Thermoleophilaceae bacterium]|nr:peptidoglycan-binding domain-containing protein [Thermoleophilaceae bacterium]